MIVRAISCVDFFFLRGEILDVEWSLQEECVDVGGNFYVRVFMPGWSECVAWLFGLFGGVHVGAEVE